MFDPDHLREVLRCFQGKRLVVVGDIILDEYITGTAHRLSPEAPVPVVDVPPCSTRYALGGAGNVARNVQALGGLCELFSVVDAVYSGNYVSELCREVELGGTLFYRAEWKTPHKTRVVVDGHQIVRLDREGPCRTDKPTRRQLADLVAAQLMVADAMILSDYGKGLLTPKLIHRLMAEAQHFNVPVFVDPKKGASVYDGAWLIKPNAQEAMALTGTNNVRTAGWEMRGQAGGSDVIITQGAEGALVFDGPGKPARIPTVPQQVRDVQGAGDTTMAALALARISGATIMESAVIGNAAASVVVSKPGTAHATTQEVSQALGPGGILEAQREGETDGTD
jgi:D-beta-D-heptose 7-phosphate kinase/D-beta-D-heptose 1-phosphate adenosyltransferase